MKTEYMFNASSEPGRQQVDCLTSMLDDTSNRMITDLGIAPGWRCLELGAGNGSIAHWLASRVCPDGAVVAVDADTRWLDRAPNVVAHQQDINDGLPGDGGFDLIHARLLLMHLSRREQLLGDLVEALAPGGWLLLGELSGRRATAVAASDPADTALFERVLEVGMNRVARPGGMDLEWGHDVADHMLRAGLTQVRSEEFAFTAAGGSPGLRYYESLLNQVAEPLHDVGITEDELRRFSELMRDPGFMAWSYQFVFTWGRRPPVQD